MNKSGKKILNDLTNDIMISFVPTMSLFHLYILDFKIRIITFKI